MRGALGWKPVENTTEKGITCTSFLAYISATMCMIHIYVQQTDNARKMNLLTVQGTDASAPDKEEEEEHEHVC